jgi:large subunit ribosomal protein L29
MMKIAETRELNTSQLHKELASQERSLLNLRFRKATLQLSDSNEVRKTRLNIARIKTVIRERQIVAAMRPQAQASGEKKDSNG